MDETALGILLALLLPFMGTALGASFSLLLLLIDNVVWKH